MLSTADIDRLLATGRDAIIANVHNGRHWVLLTGRSGGRYTTNDPGTQTSPTYAHSEMVGFRTYKKA